MDVRMLFGRYSGQIVDLETETALAMLKDGRAENPYLDNTEPRLRADAVSGINIEPAPGRKKKVAR